MDEWMDEVYYVLVPTAVIVAWFLMISHVCGIFLCSQISVGCKCLSESVRF